MRHLLGIADLQNSDIDTLFSNAQTFSNQKHPATSVWKRKKLLTLFLENSTRTVVSFEAAARNLGAEVIHFQAKSSSLQKGETLIDTGRNIQAMGVDGVVLRSDKSGSPQLLAQALSIPVINAGDGMHEHPTQALLDTWTLHKHWGSLQGKRVLLLGDIKHSRVARSNMLLWKRMGMDVSACGPPTFLPLGLDSVWGVKRVTDLDQALETADAVYCLRVQRERMGAMLIPSTTEYRHFWGLTRKRTSLLKKGAVVLHPGPTNRGVEVDPEVADGPHSKIIEQVQNGVWMRMAVLDWVAT